MEFLFLQEFALQRRLLSYDIANALSGKNYGKLDLKSRGGGLLSIFGRQAVPFFRVSFSPIFSRTGYQSKDLFLEQVVRKAHFLLSRLLSQQCSV